MLFTNTIVCNLYYILMNYALTYIIITILIQISRPSRNIYISNGCKFLKNYCWKWRKRQLHVFYKTIHLSYWLKIFCYCWKQNRRPIYFALIFFLMKLRQILANNDLPLLLGFWLIVQFHRPFVLLSTWFTHRVL